MSIVTLNASGGADPAEAWERYARPARWSEWSPQITRVEADAERLVAGMTGRVVGPLGVSIDFVVDSVDEAARRWRWTVHRGPVTMHLEHGVTGGPRGSRTSLQIDGPLLVIVAYAPLARIALGRLVRH
jgi:hypothetical protein